jgi:hypothetical protein
VHPQVQRRVGDSSPGHVNEAGSRIWGSFTGKEDLKDNDGLKAFEYTLRTRCHHSVFPFGSRNLAAGYC